MTAGPPHAGAAVVRELVKRYPKRDTNAVDGLSFEVGQGEVFGLRHRLDVPTRTVGGKVSPGVPVFA